VRPRFRTTNAKATFHLLFPSQDDEPVSQMYFDGERLNEKDWWLPRHHRCTDRQTAAVAVRS
jgi:hypothetical protein